MQLTVYAPAASTSLVPLFPVPVPAGPAAAVEQQPEWINILDHLTRGRSLADIAFLRVSGDSMQEANILDGDLLVVERTETARAGEVVIAEVNGEFTVKRLKEHTHGLYLVPANDQYPVRQVHAHDTFRVWAIVTFVIHQFHRMN